ncbi:hypothetical protein PPYR_00484 [Photinus pyralis]|uniref:Uncharacterized protein n=1 Tax=Photinus pyralis TaxID=7054 RepID=A0A1Y1NHG7_PHOPY|nr:uncharacterized protein LOC116160330 [Photinus pyralis]KAB0803514.1 hypothetical protein PPYR_00484 [Photinus pyralis]
MWKALLLVTLHLCAANEFFGPGFPFGEDAGGPTRFSPDLSNLGDQIKNSVHNQLAKSGVFSLQSQMKNLGETIVKNVQQSLSPVYAIPIKQKMMKGVGGLTTVTYYGKDVQSFIIQDGARTVCNGIIENGHCKGSLEPFTVRSNEDFCYADSYAVVNDRVCLSFGPINVAVMNNDIICNGAKSLLLNKAEYNQLCGAGIRAVYVYYADPRNPNAVPIPNPNPNIKCHNNEPGVCMFEDIPHLNSNTVVSNRNSYSYSYQSN